MAISDQLISISNSKAAIKSAIEAKGQTVGTAPLADYAGKISAIVSGGAAPVEWVRPADWLTMPTVSATENKIVMLVAVFDTTTNWVSFTCGISGSGNYTVDWGDGTSNTYINIALASHTYTYSNISASTASSRGYRQAIITVTPVTGAFITFYSSGTAKHPSNISTTGNVNPYLDIIVSAPSVGLVVQGSTSTIYGSATICERVQILSAASLAAFCFQNMKSLQKVTYPSTITATGSNLFAGCTMLQTVPSFTAAGSGSVVAASMFNGCSNLIAIPPITLAPTSNYSLSSMFAGCSKLTSIDNLTITGSYKINDASSLFNGCYALTSVPAWDYSSSTTMLATFQNCYSLQSIPDLNIPLATTTSGLFSGCISLRTAPAITTTTALINVSSMFSGCTTLLKIPNFITSAAQGWSTFASNCQSLVDGGGLNIGASISATSMWSSCINLSKNPGYNYNITFSVANCKLDAATLDALYTSLSATGTGKTITVTGNPGTGTDSPSIATGKGWTVTG